MANAVTTPLDAPQIHTDLPGPKARSALARDRQFVSPSYTRAYPLVAHRGLGCVIEDVDGNRFLDFTAGIAVTATGHCHPDVVHAIQDQAASLIHMSGTDFYYEPQIALAERLAAIAPGPEPKKVFFGNSGAEAVEAALKLARYHTGRSQVIAFHGAFHGRTYGAMSLGASKALHRRGFSPLVSGIHHVPFGCPVERIHDQLFRHLVSPEEVAAIFVEPLQGEGGYKVPPVEFLTGLRSLCDRHGILLVADEVQSGMGRTGRMFAVEHFGVVPDILCLAKGIASGMPLGAIVARADLMDWPSGSHASTFGGNPVSCRAALVTLDLLEREYIGNAAERGEQLKSALEALAAPHDWIGEVRGLGLMVAMDIVKDRRRFEPDPTRRNQIVEQAFHHGLLLLGCGQSAVRFSPPLCVTAEQVETAVGILGEVLDRGDA
jgi:4-aminobutyrate aminotransferase